MTRTHTLAATALLLCALVAPALAYDAGDPVREFTGTDSDGKAHKLSAYRGKVVVVVAWCSQCMACRGYSAKLAQLAAKNPDVVFLGVASNAGETNASINQARKSSGLSFPIIRDPGGSVAKGFGAMVMPTAYVIDAQGTLRYQGAIADRPKKAKQEFLAQAIDAAKKGASPPQAKTGVKGTRIKY